MSAADQALGSESAPRNERRSPAEAQLLSACRQAARLRVENGRLIKQVERLQREHRGRASHARAPLRPDAIGTSRRKLAG